MSMPYEKARSPRWANPAQTVIELEVDFSFLVDEWVPFAASPDDGTIYGPELFARAVAGDFGVISPYVAPPAPVPQSITRRQCARELFSRQMISGLEMVNMTATGTPPAMIEAVFAAMPQADQWVARADFAADTYERSNALLNSLMASAGATPSDINGFFRSAAIR
jgi:hypothetical protein